MTISRTFPRSAQTATRNELDLELHVVEGKVPVDLGGYFFVTAPVGTVETNGLPYDDPAHFLNGDGMVYRYGFHNGTVKVRTRLSKPPCFYADLATKTGSPYEALGFKNFGVARASLRLGARDYVNTAMMVMEMPGEIPRLFLTYDAGRPYEIDTESCEVVTPIGSNAEWRPEGLEHLPFTPNFSSAHPFSDGHTGETFLVNYGRGLNNFLSTIPMVEKLEGLPEKIDNIATTLLDDVSPRGARILHHVEKAARSISAIAIGSVERLTHIPENFIYVMKWDGKGALERWRLVDEYGVPIAVQQSLHQVCVTRDFVVIADTAFKVGLDGIFGNPLPQSAVAERIFRSVVTKPQSADTTFYFVPRPLLVDGEKPNEPGAREVNVRATKAVVPRETVHFLANYDNPNDQITIHLVHSCATDSSEWLRSYDTSLYTGKPMDRRVLGMFAMGEMDLSVIAKYTFNAKNGSVVESHLVTDAIGSWGTTFYAGRAVAADTHPPEQIIDLYWNSGGFWPELMSQFIFDLYKDYPHRLEPLERIERMDREGGVPPSLFRIHTPTMAIADKYVFTDGSMPGSPHFIPRTGSTGTTDGYLVCTVFTPQQSELWIFDAAALSSGPIARLFHPELKFGMTLHSAYLSEIGPRQAKYNVPVRPDFEERTRADPKINELFEKVIFPRYETP